MKQSIRFLITIIIFTLFNACSDKQEPEQPKDKCEFAVLVYMIASNSLGTSNYDYEDLAEMKRAAADIPENTRWMVYRASANSTALPVLMELNRDGSWTTLKEYSSHVSATTARLEEVINDFRNECQPDADGIVFWSHASGWLEDGIDQTPAGMQKSFGQDFGQCMNVTDMAEVLNRQPFKYIYFDACYMATIEVVYQLRHAADYIVGSPSELVANGMPYNVNLPLLLSADPKNLEAATRSTFEYYNAQADPEMRTCTMTMVQTDALDRLAAATAPIYAVSDLPHPLKTATNYRGTTNTGYSLDFGEYVNALCDANDIDRDVVDEFNAALNSAVVYYDATPMLWNRWNLANPTGLATYVFNSSDNFTTKNYHHLEWAQKVVKPRLQL